ncbi:MAG TPA: hypothetical protein P5311_02665 [Candidatus Dojkabacteria bacterium]|nr:hypothetical protein [Candidatus Dojkabacteria bacterium]
MQKTIKNLFFIQLGLVLLSPILILIGIHFPFGGIIPALAIVSIIMVSKNLKRGLLKTSLIINNLSILLFPLFFTVIILMLFPLGSLFSQSKIVGSETLDLVLKSSVLVSSVLGMVTITAIYLTTSIIITILYAKERQRLAKAK